MFSPSGLHLLLALPTLAMAAIQPFSDWAHERIQLTDTSIHFRYSNSGKPPLLLVHCFPEHSRTWETIGPVLAQYYTVIAPDNRGTGDSSLSASDNYTAPAAGEDLRAIVDFLNITRLNVLAHDKGVGLATSFAIEDQARVNRLILIEYPLPGYGYTETVSSTQLYRDWQLAFFAVPDAAQYFIQGREKEMLAWYFYHGSYAGDDVVSNALLETYTRSISKPGFLRAGLMYFAAAFGDAEYFTRRINESGKLRMPLLALGGEASFAPQSALEASFAPVAADLTTDIILKSGHWIGVEAPVRVAERALQFFGNGTEIPSVDLSSLDHTIVSSSWSSREMPADSMTPMLIDNVWQLWGWV
ncbi:hypothetical protein LTR91_010635 [Friedmanniomyces endolithicus]|uniref:AB hydrolase-1 domain-containing protein n=1 Tax=Friedmanniomyces endolithicus TaxID=329885 RepID=A0AAN6KIM4_9PEZI|nr:hypothetical protein LTR57_010313 [Friedmanniomyces endolithicus]KAK0971043.1 hypothetical protein LTS01_015503 [Friedmanniomyces endolithicus]KAK0985213.1 hypothetical protein LTR91_010635 [Friedmanniomyces endolithicus]KAK1043598.1 hypothetical protein LTS16_007944 [Friedmanniomyces endolithicus]